VGAVHDDFEERRRQNSDADDITPFSGPADPSCWRPGWCRKDTYRCPGSTTLRRCGMFCRFPLCPRNPGVVCPADVRECWDGQVLNRDPRTCQFPKCRSCPTDTRRCTDGTILRRDPATCRFPQCPRTPTSCPTSLGFYTCDDGTRVRRDPRNNCITWLPCPISTQRWTCATGGQKIPMSQVCDGKLDCRDGSDEWKAIRTGGCYQYPPMTIGGRRLDQEPVEDALAIQAPESDALDFLAPEMIPESVSVRRRPRHNCFTYDLPAWWSRAKQEWCCSNFQIACEFTQRYNCRTRETWSWQKRDYCCSNYGLGCRSASQCTGDLVFDECHSPCDDVCGQPEGLVCATVCEAKCACPRGMYRLEKNSNTCVHPDFCPADSYYDPFSATTDCLESEQAFGLLNETCLYIEGLTFSSGSTAYRDSLVNRCKSMDIENKGPDGGRRTEADDQE